MARLSRREREQQLEVDFIGAHYKDPNPEEPEEEQVAKDDRALKVPTSEQDIEKSFGTGLKADIKEVSDHLTELRSMPLTLMKAKLAKEYDLEAKDLIDKIANSHESAITSFLNKLHKAGTAAMNRMFGVPKEMRAECQRIQIEWNTQVQRKVAEERRAREAAAQAEQAAARAAEIEHLRLLKKEEAAEELAASPLPPVSLPPPLKPAGKVEGVTLIPVWKVGDEPFNDETAFWKWFSENPAYWPGVELRRGDWKKWLSSNKGNLLPPGLNVVEDTETRTQE